VEGELRPKENLKICLRSNAHRVFCTNEQEYDQGKSRSDNQDCDI
jgi:hypothetical protein